jgi:hypothetical protein
MFLHKALPKAPVLVLVLFAVASFAVPALAASYGVTVQMNSPSYTGSQKIMINGTVSPSPGPNTAVVLTTTNPGGTVVDYQEDAVNPSTGAYNGSIVAGGTANWIAGRYLVNATWGSSGSASQTTTFQYSPAGTPTTTSVSCTPAIEVVYPETQCTATVSGASGTISGETIAFSQTGGAGAVNFPSPATCVLSGTSCSVFSSDVTPGPVTIQASYPGDANNAASSGTANVTVPRVATSIFLACTVQYVGVTSSCKATVAGGESVTPGEIVTFSQNGTGSVTLPSPPTCGLNIFRLESAGCAIELTGNSPGPVTINASFGGDAIHAPSSGTTTITITQNSTSTSTTGSTSSTSSASSTTTTTTSTTSASSSSSGGSGTLIYLVVAVVVIIAIVIGIVSRRRRVASNDGRQPTA